MDKVLYRRRLAILIFLTVSVSTCKTGEKNSHISGHYENFSEAELLPYKGKVRIIPEYEESSGVMISVEAVEQFGLHSLLHAFKQHPKKPDVFLPMLDSHYDGVPPRLIDFLSDGQFKLFSLPRGSGRVDGDITWTRDWAPWTAMYRPSPDAANERRFAEFNYYELRDTADELPQQIAEKLNVGRFSIPVRTEGGNFMINGRGDCMMTTGVIEREQLVKAYGAQLEMFKKERNESGNTAYDAVIARYEALTANSTSYGQAEIEGFFRDYAGCKQIIWLNPSPSDSNQHIDLFAKFLSDNMVLVMDLNNQTIATTPKSRNPEAALDIEVSQALLKSVQAHLNEVAQILSQRGFQVVRAPLPLTMLYRSLSQGQQTKLPMVKGNYGLLESVRSGKTIDIDALFNEDLAVHMRSYANSLILKPYVYVPRFKAPVIEDGNARMVVLGGDALSSSQYPDAALLPHYEKEVEAAYGQARLQVVWIDSDQTVTFQGSIHCLTEQVGRIPVAE